MKYVLIIGAKNELGIELANLYARNNYNLYLAGRSIKDIQDKSDKIIFVSCFTIEPNHDRVEEYLIEFEKEILSNETSELWITGYQAQHISKHKNHRFQIFESFFGNFLICFRKID